MQPHRRRHRSPTPTLPQGEGEKSATPSLWGRVGVGLWIRAGVGLIFIF